MNTRFPWLRVTFTAFLPLLSAMGQGSTNALDSIFPDPVVAEGKGFEIKRSELDDAFFAYQSEMASRRQNVPDAARTDYESNILEHLIINKIEAQRATDEEKAEVNDMVAKRLDEFRKSEPSEAAFQAEIKAFGGTLEQVRARGVEEQLGKVVLIRELVPSNAVSDAAIQQFYDAHTNDFTLPEQVRIAQILISTMDSTNGDPLPQAEIPVKQKLAREVLGKATNGGDFSKLAAQYSDDLSTKTNGGEYPPFARGMVSADLQQIEAAAFTLKTNQISDLVETHMGYHIIKLLEKIPPSLVNFTNAAPQIKDYLTKTELDKALPAFVPKMETEYEVKTSDLSLVKPKLLPLVHPAPDVTNQPPGGSPPRVP